MDCRDVRDCMCTVTTGGLMLLFVLQHVEYHGLYSIMACKGVRAY